MPLDDTANHRLFVLLKNRGLTEEQAALVLDLMDDLIDHAIAQERKRILATMSRILRR